MRLCPNCVRCISLPPLTSCFEHHRLTCGSDKKTVFNIFNLSYNTLWHDGSSNTKSQQCFFLLYYLLVLCTVMPDRGKSGLWETKDESFASQTDQPAYYQRIFLGPQQSCLHIFNNTLWNTMQTAYPAVQAGYHFSPAVCCHHFGLLFFLSL